jgi:hypothetical protein
MFEDSGEVDNIIHAGVVFAAYLFIAILLYYALSKPLDIFFDAIGVASVGTASASPMSYILPDIRWGLNVAFALFLAFPIAWFVLWIFSKEPDFSFLRRE